MNKRHTSGLWRRRDFLNTGAHTAAALTLMSVLPAEMKALATRLSSAHMIDTEDTVQSADPELMEKLVLTAIDAARSAGAEYAEARVNRTVEQWLSKDFNSDTERLTIGVRALVNGAWGFASSTYWEVDEPGALAKDAVAQAKINAAVFPREIELGVYPVARGSWVTPIRIDPFKIPIEEKLDFFRSLEGGLPRYIAMRKYEAQLYPARFARQERMTATSEGALFSQTLYESGGAIFMVATADEPQRGVSDVKLSVRDISTAGAGWELFLDAKIRDQFPMLADEAEELLYLPVKPVDVGRYETVMTAGAVSGLLATTLGNATQLDRAVGMEANAGGTSYLGPDPEEHLGTALGSSLLTVMGNRSLPRGLATVKWDEEGVEPDTFPIIQNGTFVDYQTTREQAPWLASWYQSRQQPVRSHGCAVTPEALNFPTQHTPNLQMMASSGTTTFEDMIANTKKGVAFVGGRVLTDFQSRTGGSNRAFMREITDGKLGAILQGADILFTSSELWKSLVEVGGTSSVEVASSRSEKGQPSQTSSYSIEAVPARFKEITVIDGTRR